MCGLCGEITFDGSPASVEAVTAMAEVLAAPRSRWPGLSRAIAWRSAIAG